MSPNDLVHEKRNPIGEIIKWKVRLLIGGRYSIKFVDYWNIYSPAVSWKMIQLVCTLALVNNWYIHSIDCVLAFLYVDVKIYIYMSPPKVSKSFNIPDLPTFNDRITKVCI